MERGVRNTFLCVTVYAFVLFPYGSWISGLIWELVMAYEVTWVRPFSKRKGKTEQERFWWESCLSAFPSTTRRAAAVPPVCQAARTLAVVSRASLHQRSHFQPILNLHPQKGPSSHPQLHSPDGHSPLPPWSRHKVWIPSPTLTSPRFWAVRSGHVASGLQPLVQLPFSRPIPPVLCSACFIPNLISAQNGFFCLCKSLSSKALLKISVFYVEFPINLFQLSSFGLFSSVFKIFFFPPLWASVYL